MHVLVPDAPGQAAKDGGTRRRPGAGRRILHRAVVVVALCLAVAFAGQPVAQAATGSPAYKSYARAQLGGNGTQFTCLDHLWTAESGWNPNARNRSSTAYGIPQFLNSTWAMTGIAKTANPYRQIDAGRIYIKKVYATPCGAWAHFRAHHWY